MKYGVACVLVSLTLLSAYRSGTDAAGLVFDQRGSVAATAHDDGVLQLCPDSKSTCDVQSTCCSSSDGASACCPLSNAVCCSDGAHCCPHGTTCNDERSSCDVIPTNVTRPAVRKQPPSDVSTTDGRVDALGMVCPDHSQCTYAGAACCRQYSGRFGCCNYPLNVCCDDGVHCCHTGTVCDQLRLLCIPYPSAGAPQRQPWTHHSALASPATASAGQATSSIENVEVADVDQATENKNAKNVICPDGSQCPDGDTCCPLLGGGRYGCCPFSLATCCADRLHCCPFLTVCTVSGQCVRDSEQNAPWSPLRLRTPE